MKIDSVKNIIFNIHRQIEEIRSIYNPLQTITVCCGPDEYTVTFMLGGRGYCYSKLTDSWTAHEG